MNSAVIDLMIRIKNGYMARNEEVLSPYSSFREEVLKKLKQTKYIKTYKVQGVGVKKELVVDLLYKEGEPALLGVKLFSSPGRRWYISKKEIQPVLGGVGIGIVSTSKGVLTNKEARKEGVGGELLFELW